MSTVDSGEVGRSGAWKGAGKVVVGFGVAMIALGVVAYFVTGRSSVTALIPSFVGVLVAGLGLLSLKVGRRAVISAGLLGVLAGMGPVMRVVPPATRGEFELNSAVVVQLSFVVLALGLIGYVLLALVKLKK